MSEYGLNLLSVFQHTADMADFLIGYVCLIVCVCVRECGRYSPLSPESLAVVALGGLHHGRGCVEQQHRKRVKALRAN